MIQFTNTGGISQNSLRMAYNNDVVVFYSNINIAQRFCIINAAGPQGSFSLRLYPAPDDTFYFNFKGFITALVNKKYFADTLNVDLDIQNADSFVYNWTENALAELTVEFRILLDLDEEGGLYDTATYNLSWLAGVQQPGSYIPMEKDKLHVLLPHRRDTANHHQVKYWQGYPFDIGLYNTGNTLWLYNGTNLQQASFTVPGKVTRLVFADGRTDETIEDFLPLTEGYNRIRIKQQAEDTDADKFIDLVKEPYRCGVYLKWLNRFGTYSYWLFDDTTAVDRSFKSIGELYSDDNNLVDAVTRSLNMGMQSRDNLKVMAELLTEGDMDILQDITDSPKIYLFSGAPFARNNTTDWLEITLKTSNVRIKNFRQKLNNLFLEFDLPERYTQTL